MSTHIRPLPLAIAGLLVTGVVAGGVAFLGFLVGTQPNLGVAGALVGLTGVVGCLALLAWSWRPLASDGRWAVGGAALTGLLLVIVVPVFVYASVAPYGWLVCKGSTAGFCPLGALVVAPTLGAVIPWTIAGLPALITLALRHRRNVGGARKA
ncbi:hypothetical protein [Fodinicola acaciae]|uniref:hypothetical protein n=1 Tax=Fodinicola acaciae TaxID=2681555 RepID=UPI0013D4DD7B|nr:hypothetical protein [Fodinicola acaciae]